MKQRTHTSSTLQRGGEIHMRHKWMLAAALTITLVAFAQKNDSPEVMLGAGLHQEEIDGDCREAIKTFQKVIQLKNVPRNVAARAQFHIGTCQEKLGQREARIAYEAVLNRYADQTETAVQARARIAALGGPGNERRQSAAMANRQIGALDPN